MVKNNRNKRDKSTKKMAIKRKHEDKASEQVVANTKIPQKQCEAKSKNELKQNNVESDPESVIKKSKLSDEAEKYPILKDESFIQKIHSVSLTNNQKGRIRQNLKDSLKGTSDCLLPDIIHNKIQAILKNSETHTDADLRKMRILFNMLNTAAQTEIPKPKKMNKEGTHKEVSKKKNVAKEETDLNLKKDVEDKESKQKENNNEQKKKGPKRYVVFIGNLPMDIDKEKITQHFSDIKSFIKDVRLPKQKEGKEAKSAIAYVELENETTFELALSKHHSMLGNKRINVLYTTQKNGKITKTEAKGKSAKLIALQKSGQLAGSIPMNRKRSQRRLKKKKALAKLAAESA